LGRKASQRRTATEVANRDNLVGVSVTGAFAPPARGRQLEAGNLHALPLLDRGAIEAPIAADAKTRETTLAEEAVDGCGVDAQMLGQFLDCEDIVPSGNRLRRTV
jgi:hypothetical protein